MKGEGKWPEAVQHFREAVRLDPELAPAHYNLAEIRAYQGGLDEAIAHYRQALRIDPEFARAEYMLGVALAGRGRMDEAKDRYQRALRIDPADAKAHEKTFGHAQARGTILYQRTFWIDPKFTPSHNNLGLTPRDADRLNEAIGHYEKALRIDPGLFRAHAALGQALLALGRFRDAQAATRRCLDRLPQGHELHANVLAQLRRCERLIALQDRLPAVLQGEDKPADASETLEFAELCGILGRHCLRRTPVRRGPRPRRRNWPGTSAPTTATGPPAPPRWPAAAAATGPISAERSGRAGASGPASGFGPRSPSGPGCWTAVRMRIASWSATG